MFLIFNPLFLFGLTGDYYLTGDRAVQVMFSQFIFNNYKNPVKYNFMIQQLEYLVTKVKVGYIIRNTSKYFVNFSPLF